MAVNRGAATGDLAPRVGNLTIGGGFGDQPPIMRARRTPGVQQIGRGLIDGRIIGAGFEQHHAAIGVLAQPGGEDRPGRAGTDNDVIVIHDRLIQLDRMRDS